MVLSFAGMECNSVFEPLKRNWECTIDYDTCQKKKPEAPKPPPEPKEEEPNLNFYDDEDDNGLTESIVKGVSAAGVTELSNKLHVSSSSWNFFG